MTVPCSHMRCLVKTVACGLAWIMAACGELPTAPATPFRVLTFGFFSQINETTAVVARGPADWEALLGRVSPGEPPAAVEFSSEMAVLVSAGTRPSGGYRVRVEGVSRRGQTLEVAAVEETPGRCGAPTVLTQPFEIIAVPRGGLVVVIAWSKRTALGC